MILQALCEYYERKSKLGEIAPIGFEWKPIPFLIVIDLDGNLKSLKDTREKVDKKLVAKSFLVPQSIGRSGPGSWKTSFLLWDHWGYVLGYPKGDASKERKKRNELLRSVFENAPNKETESITFLRKFLEEDEFYATLTAEDIDIVIDNLTVNSQIKAATQLVKDLIALKKAKNSSHKQLGTFINLLKTLPNTLKEDEGIGAVLKFYEKHENESVFELENWMDCAAVGGANMTFQIMGKSALVLASNLVTDYQKEHALVPENDDSIKSLCLVSGKDDYIERIHSATPISGGQASGKLVAFKTDKGFDSYGKEQGFNAPVGRYAQTAYSTALNTLTKNEVNRVFVGDTTIVFWSEEANFFEQNFSFFFTKPKDDPDKGVGVLRQLYESIISGKLNNEGQTRFYVLGLVPNAARISVRYWLNGTISEFSNHIKQHFDDLEIVRGDKDDEFFALSSMLANTALEYKMSNVIPNLAGQVTEAALMGSLYPRTLLHATIRRIRAEQHVTRTRAAIIKACINRYNRFYCKTEEEITVSLDKTNNRPAYLLGRLFAVLEKVQYKAQKIETIRERYYGAFSSTPVTVYPQLMKLKNHHLAKLDSGKNFFENLIGEIIDGLPGTGDIPRQFSLEEQGRFAVGYYHQRQDLKYKGKKSENNEEIQKEN